MLLSSSWLGLSEILIKIKFQRLSENIIQILQDYSRKLQIEAVQKVQQLILKTKITESMIWCYACDKETTISLFSTTCAVCGSAAIEKSEDSHNSPSQFRPYVVGGEQIASNNQAPSNQEEEQDIDIPIAVSIRTVFLESLDRPGQFTVIRVVSNLVPPTDARIPVPKEIVQRLEKVQEVKECAVCQEEGGKGLKLPCSHSFHDHCLKPWMEQTNTCPTCRTEIKF